MYVRLMYDLLRVLFFPLGLPTRHMHRAYPALAAYPEYPAYPAFTAPRHAQSPSTANQTHPQPHMPGLQTNPAALLLWVDVLRYISLRCLGRPDLDNNNDSVGLATNIYLCSVANSLPDNAFTIYIHDNLTSSPGLVTRHPHPTVPTATRAPLIAIYPPNNYSHLSPSQGDSAVRSKERIWLCRRRLKPHIILLEHYGPSLQMLLGLKPWEQRSCSCSNLRAAA